MTEKSEFAVTHTSGGVITSHLVIAEILHPDGTHSLTWEGSATLPDWTLLGMLDLVQTRIRQTLQADGSES